MERTRIMKTIYKTKVRDYLEESARPMDLALYDFHFNVEKSYIVLSELTKYQNEDGGFGNAIEPDLRMPNSSALGTSVAFQYLSEIGVNSKEQVVQKGIEYFTQTYNSELVGWEIIRPESNDHPHAPWWDYERSLKNFDWGNPSAEILGYLLKYRNLVNDGSLIKNVTDKALERLREIDEPEFHEILDYLRLYENSDSVLQTKLFDLLANLIKKVVSINPTKWSAYSATPLTFVKSPESPFATLFNKAILHKNIEHIVKGLVNDTHWEPNWDWAGEYSEIWLQAKQEWSGKVTVDNMVLLKNFGWEFL